MTSPRRSILDLADALRELVMCEHPASQVQEFTEYRAGDGTVRRGRFERCQQCGSARMHDDTWFAPRAVFWVERALRARKGGSASDAHREVEG